MNPTEPYLTGFIIGVISIGIPAAFSIMRRDDRIRRLSDKLRHKQSELNISESFRRQHAQAAREAKRFGSNAHFTSNH